MKEMGPEQSPSMRHIPALDGLRGVAVLMVMLMHFSQFQRSGTPVTQILHRLFGCGWIGVDLFFVLSGFLITGILIDSKSGPGYFTNFYMRRALRIFPLYYAYVCGVLFFVVPLAQGPGLLHSANVQAVAQNKPYFLLYATNLLLGRQGESLNGFVSHLWSLAIEEHFYLLWPLVVFFVPARHLAKACWMVIAGAVASRVWFVSAGTWPHATYLFTPCRMDALAVGGLAAISVRKLGIPNLAPGLAKAAFWLGGGYLVFYMVFRHGLAWVWISYEVVGKTVAAMFFGLCVLFIVNARAASPTSRFFSNPVLRFFGRYSYGLYIFHMGVWLVKVRLRIPEHLAAHSVPPLLAWFVDLLLPLAVSIPVAFCSWHLFEKQFLKLKRFFQYPPEIRAGGCSGEPSRADPSKQ